MIPGNKERDKNIANSNLINESMFNQISSFISRPEEKIQICLIIFRQTPQKQEIPIIFVQTTFQIYTFVKRRNQKYSVIEQYSIFDITKIKVDQNYLILGLIRKQDFVLMIEPERKELCTKIATQIWSYLKSICYKIERPIIDIPDIKNIIVKPDPFTRFMVKALNRNVKIPTQISEQVEYFFNTHASVLVLSEFGTLKKLFPIFVGCLLLITIDEIIIEDCTQRYIEYFSHYLKYTTTLKKLVFQNTKVELDFKPLIDAMATNARKCPLEEIVFHNYAISRKTLDTIFLLMNLHPIHKFTISSPVGNSTILKEFSHLLSKEENVVAVSGITILSVINPNASTDLTKFMSRVQHIESLTLDHINLELTDILAKLNIPSLKYLDLSNNYSTNEITSNMIPQSLRTLKLSNIKWGDKVFSSSFISIIEALNNPGTTLDLSNAHLKYNKSWNSFFTDIFSYFNSKDPGSGQSYTESGDTSEISDKSEKSKGESSSKAQPTGSQNLILTFSKIESVLGKPKKVDFHSLPDIIVSQSISNFCWAQNPIQTSFVKVLKGFSNIQTLNISGCIKSGDKDNTNLYSYLSQSQLVRLIIQGNDSGTLTLKDFELIFIALLSNSTLTELDISNHKIGSQFIKPITQFILQKTNLEWINFNGNRIYQPEEYEFLLNELEGRETPIEIVWPEIELMTMFKSKKIDTTAIERYSRRFFDIRTKGIDPHTILDKKSSSIICYRNFIEMSDSEPVEESSHEPPVPKEGLATVLGTGKDGPIKPSSSIATDKFEAEMEMEMIEDWKDGGGWEPDENDSWAENVTESSRPDVSDFAKEFFKEFDVGVLMEVIRTQV